MAHECIKTASYLAPFVALLRAQTVSMKTMCNSVFYAHTAWHFAGFMALIMLVKTERVVYFFNITASLHLFTDILQLRTAARRNDPNGHFNNVLSSGMANLPRTSHTQYKVA